MALASGGCTAAAAPRAIHSGSDLPPGWGRTARPARLTRSILWTPDSQGPHLQRSGSSPYPAKALDAQPRPHAPCDHARHRAIDLTAPLDLTSRPQNASSPPLFFFQAEDGIRDGTVTGVQTCALPI